MIKKRLVSTIIFLIMTTNAFAQTNQKIEIFDIDKGKIIKKVPFNTESQHEVKKFLEGITGVYVKYNPIPNQGFMIRVPLQPNILVKNQWFHDLVDEVVIIFSGEENPYLMVYDNENRMHFYTFKGDTDKFFSLLNYRPKTSE